MSIYNFNMKRFVQEKDDRGLDPAFFIACSRVRGTGKTYSTVGFLLNFIKENPGRKFGLFCRTKAMLGGLAEGMFKSYMGDKMPGWNIYEVIKMKGLYSDIYIETGDGDEKEKLHIGYVLPLNSASGIKNVSSTFVDIDWMFFDEFLPEFGNEYLSNEIEKFDKIMGSISRGGGKISRYVPVIFCSNTVSMFNPYFDAFGLLGKLQEDSKRYKGPGIVFQMIENVALAKKHLDTPYARAMARVGGNDYTGDVWFKNNNSGIEKPDNWGDGIYKFTLYKDGKAYAVKWYAIVEKCFIDSKNIDNDFRLKFRYDNNNLELPSLKESYLFDWLRARLSRGQVRFSDYVARSIFYDEI